MTLLIIFVFMIVSLEPLMGVDVGRAEDPSGVGSLDLVGLERVSRDVYSMQPALVFARFSGIHREVMLRVAVNVSAVAEPRIPGLSLPLPLYVVYNSSMLPVPWASGWYFAAILGLPAIMYASQLGFRLSVYR